MQVGAIPAQRYSRGRYQRGGVIVSAIFAMKMFH